MSGLGGGAAGAHRGARMRSAAQTAGTWLAAGAVGGAVAFGLLVPDVSAQALTCDQALTDALTGVPGAVLDGWLVDGSVSSGELADYGIVLDCSDGDGGVSAEPTDPEPVDPGAGSGSSPSPQPSSDPAPSAAPAPAASQSASAQSPGQSGGSAPGGSGSSPEASTSSGGAAKAGSATRSTPSGSPTEPASVPSSQAAPAALDGTPEAGALADTRQSPPAAVAPDARLLADPSSSVTGAGAADDSGLLGGIVALSFGAAATGGAALWLQRRRKPARHSAR